MRKTEKEIRTVREAALADHSTDFGATKLRLMATRLIVFTTGAVIMGLEIAGSRVLAPAFGNSVFVWGSLISVFLLAMSIGYYFGGRIVDRFPSHRLFHSACVFAAVWIAGLAFVATPVCEAIVAAGFGEELGPLLAAALLFGFPSIALGMISPFAIRLSAQSIASVGGVAGSYYALSTIGSIVGTMATTFLLIPTIGVASILKAQGTVLLVIVMISSLLTRSWRTVIGPAVLFLAIAVLLWWLPAPRDAIRADEVVIHDAETAYHHITVTENEKENHRRLCFDRYTETIIDLSPPYRSLAPYTDSFHLAFLLQPDLQSALFIGAGGGVGPREFLAHNPAIAIDVVDVDAKVLEVARDYFYLENSPTMETIADDGRMFLRASKKQYDAIVLDAFTIGGRIPFHLATLEFFDLCRKHLREDGVFVMNINSALIGPRSRMFQSIHETLKEVFSSVYVFAMNHRIVGSRRSTNIVFVATTDPERISKEQWLARLATFEPSHSNVGLPELREWIGDLVQDPPIGASAPRLTDDFAPVETMPF